MLDTIWFQLNRTGRRRLQRSEPITVIVEDRDKGSVVERPLRMSKRTIRDLGIVNYITVHVSATQN